MKQVWNYDLLKLFTTVLLLTLSFVFPYRFLFCFLAYFVISYELFYEWIKELSVSSLFDEKFLMILATIGAFAIGEYPEAVAVMLFYQIGEYLGDKASEQTKHAVTKLMDLRVDTASVKQDANWKTVLAETITVGDIILVKPGERIPLDGRVIKGTSELDTSTMTGESMPRLVKVGDNVLSGCVNQTGILEIEVTTNYSNSTVSKILNLMEHAGTRKTKQEKFITKFAKIYTPIVVICAILLTLVPVLFQQPFSIWFYRSLTFLVVSCPCALVVSVPLTFFCGLGKSSKKGILMKSSSVLENLGEIKTILLDKTGTLTHGKFMVQEVHGEEKALYYAALAEIHSNHPIARSIQEAYKKEIDISGIIEYEEIAGKGIYMNYNGEEILVGNSNLLDDYQIIYTNENQRGTLVLVAVNHEYLGTIVITDTIKPASLSLTKHLKKLGIEEVIIVSGDNENSVGEVSKIAGVDACYASLLPTDKVEVIKSYQKKSRTMFVGDGINDAPVLLSSDIGVSMGGIGSDAAIEASDMVIMNDDISALPEAFEIAHTTRIIVKINIVFAITAKLIVLLLSLFGIVNMWLAVFADVGVTILTVCNAMRLLLDKKV